MTDWYYRASQAAKAEENGPIASPDLLKLIRDGVINEDTLIRKGDSNWVPSVQINGLWAAAGRPTAAFLCPNCGKPIPKPPVTCGACQQRIMHAVGHLVQPKKIVARPTSLTTKPISKKPQTEGPASQAQDRSKSPNNEERPKRGWFSSRKE